MNIELARSIEAAPRMVYDAWFDTAQPGGPWFGCERVIMTARPTRMTLRHTDVPDDPMGRRHEEGWGYVLDSLSARFTPPAYAKGP